ncbi:2dbfdd35-efc2-45b5-ba77-df43983dd891 [Sclerotinia trifoliorum]|uniref:2dbfdd35-efc2-45b5-ba77-df43983dd891 n=1 Tax=Sclerotinia trifoliorum TaxID=28548 RepID=A0A8H2VTM1_9HELO|nr:2dbfdd35-efc2-45b5-ba77-df43983dd891 [Sclerotinia trifoliorum]
MLVKSLITLLVASLTATAAPIATVKRGEAPDPATDIIWTKNYGDYEKRAETPDPATDIIWTKNYGDYEKA